LNERHFSHNAQKPKGMNKFSLVNGLKEGHFLERYHYINSEKKAKGKIMQGHNDRSMRFTFSVLGQFLL
jgi:hypothetical protein